MQDLFQRFLIVCKTERGHSDMTIRSYRSALKLFAEWFESQNGRQLELTDWTPTVARSYLASLKVREIRQSVRQTRVSILRSFGNWLIETKGARSNPCLGLKTPVNEDLRQPCARADVVRSLLDAADRMPNERRGRSAKAQIALLALGGLRLSEMLALHVSDVHLQCDQPHVIVRRGKGRKMRDQPLPTLACRIVEAWLEARPEAAVPFLFYQKAGKKLPERPCTDNVVYGLLDALKKIAKLRTEDLTPHSLRRFGGTAVMQQPGASIADAQKFLGHSDPAVTLRYIKPTSPLRGFVENILPAQEQPAQSPNGRLRIVHRTR